MSFCTNTRTGHCCRKHPVDFASLLTPPNFNPFIPLSTSSTTHSELTSPPALGAVLASGNPDRAFTSPILLYDHIPFLLTISASSPCDPGTANHPNHRRSRNRISSLLRSGSAHTNAKNVST